MGVAEPASHNRAKVVVGGGNEFSGNGVDILLLGNWIQNPTAFPPSLFSAGDDNLAEVVGACSPDLSVQAFDCFPSQAPCGGTTRASCPR